MSERKSVADAELAGLIVNRPDDCTLQIDIDNAADLQHFEDVRCWVTSKFHITREHRTKSKSGNTHIYLSLMEPLPIIERILIQSILGSDRKREWLSYQNV